MGDDSQWRSLAANINRELSKNPNYLLNFLPFVSIIQNLLTAQYRFFYLKYLLWRTSDSATWGGGNNPPPPSTPIYAPGWVNVFMKSFSYFCFKENSDMYCWYHLPVVGQTATVSQSRPFKRPCDHRIFTGVIIISTHCRQTHTERFRQTCLVEIRKCGSEIIGNAQC